MKTVTVEFKMDFDEKFSEAEIEEWLRYNINARGDCRMNEVYKEHGDIEPHSVSVNFYNM